MGCTFTDPTALTFVGGGIEGNGIGGAAANKGGCIIYSAVAGSLEGAAGPTFIGTYFEQNAGQADIWITAGYTDGNVTLCAMGCTFNRISNVNYTANNIRVDLVGTGAGKFSMSALSCGFVGLNTYVASAARPYVVINAGGATNYDFVDHGCTYGAAIEKPVVYGPVKTDKAFPSAWVVFTGSTGAIINSYNINTVTRTAAGTYTLSYQSPLVGSYGVTGSVSGAGSVSPFSNLSQNAVVNTLNPSGTATDFGQVMLTCWGGGDEM